MKKWFNTKEFVFGLIVIFLIPVLTELPLIMSGERTTGEVVKQIEVYDTDGTSFYDLITFHTPNHMVTFRGRQNVLYHNDEPIKIIYEKNNPTNCIVFSFMYIYGGLEAVIAGFLLLVWLMTYGAFRNKD